MTDRLIRACLEAIYWQNHADYKYCDRLKEIPNPLPKCRYDWHLMLDQEQELHDRGLL